MLTSISGPGKLKSIKCISRFNESCGDTNMKSPDVQVSLLHNENLATLQRSSGCNKGRKILLVSDSVVQFRPQQKGSGIEDESSKTFCLTGLLVFWSDVSLPVCLIRRAVMYMNTCSLLWSAFKIGQSSL